MAKTEWPGWWEWELEQTPHLLKRMLDRRFTEVDLRRMLQRAITYGPDVCEGRFAIDTRHNGKPWQVIVEPDAEDLLLVVVTAYAVETR
ncbi:MAG TPA: DUF4258 domain-containing protein [Polyangiaceae bacterium]|nr:DUF4258 domain-containing protein [Polyangiaceae bacterium]